jgi:alkylated DNA repair dioxygenase AlkB
MELGNMNFYFKKPSFEFMKLFNMENAHPIKVISEDGDVNYYGKVFSKEECEQYFEDLMKTIQWKHDEVFIFGKKIITKRQVAWYGDMGLKYTYSKTTKIAFSWTKELLKIKNSIESKTGESFNSCLLNLYHSGEEGMGWHSDDEKDLVRNSAIASVSFGTERKFVFKHKNTKETISLNLENGSLLLMKGKTQSHWSHRLPPSKKVTGPRINLTFRSISIR